MRKLILFALFIMPFADPISAQTEDNYRSRNYKLGKKHKSIGNQNSNEAKLYTEEGRETRSYLARNSKLHRTAKGVIETGDKEFRTSGLAEKNHSIAKTSVQKKRGQQKGKNLITFLTALVVLGILTQQ